MFKSFLSAAKKHRITSSIIIIAVFAAGYFFYTRSDNNSAQTRYALAVVQKGTIVVSVSGSGQVSASNQVDIKTKASGDLTFVGTQKGKEVKAGTIIAQVDSQDAQKAVRDAGTALETVELELEQLLTPIDQYSLTQAENALAQARDNLTKLKFTQETDRQNADTAEQKSRDNLKKSYEDGYNIVSSAFLDLPNIMTGLSEALFGTDFAAGIWNADFYASAANTFDAKAIQYRDDAYKSYNLARSSYDKNFSNYKSAGRFSDSNTTNALIDETYETTNEIAQAVKDATNLIQFYKDKFAERSFKPQTLTDTHLTSLSSYTGKTNSFVSGLLGAKNSIRDSVESLKNSQRAIAAIAQNQPLELAQAERSLLEKQQSLEKLNAGADELNIRAKQIAVQQKKDALLSARQNLADYSIRAPFDGIAAAVNAKKGDTVSSGAALATLITKQRLAEISLNEVDAAKIKTGQKATLTFDAIPDLTISGQILEIDTLGTVVQGVVSYNVKIAFDTQDERIKPGMSASAAIITQAKQNVLYVPNSAVKTVNGVSFVQVPAPSDNQIQSAAISQGITLLVSPRQQEIETGLSNDTSTEIVSGLKEGEQIISRTISATTQTQAQTAPSLFGGGGARMR